MGDEVGRDVLGVLGERIVAVRRPSGVAAIAAACGAAASTWSCISRSEVSVATASSRCAQPPAGASATTVRARPRAASCSATNPPSELPTMCAVSKPAASIARSIASGRTAALTSPSSRGPPAWPTSVGARTSWWRSSAGRTSSQVRQEPVKPCSRTSGVPEPPRCAGVNCEDTRPRLVRGPGTLGEARGEELPLGGVVGERQRRPVGGRRLGVAGRGGAAGRPSSPAGSGSRRAGRRARAPRPRPAPPPGPSTIATRDARFSATTGDGQTRSSSS